MLLVTAEDVLTHPVLLAVLIIVLAVIAAWQTTLGPEDRWVWSLRRLVWPLFDSEARDRGRPLTRQKDTSEYVFTIPHDLDLLETTLDAADYTPNIPSTLKYVVIDGERVYESQNWVWRASPGADDQTHCYVFSWGGMLHLHQHVEPSNVTDPEGHVNGEQTPGDPDGRLHEAFDDVPPSIDGAYLEAVEE